MKLGSLASDIVAKAHLYVPGGAPSAGLKGLSVFAGREATIDGLDVLLRHFKSMFKQVDNTVFGAIGGAVA